MNRTRVPWLDLTLHLCGFVSCLGWVLSSHFLSERERTGGGGRSRAAVDPSLLFGAAGWSLKVQRHSPARARAESRSEAGVSSHGLSVPAGRRHGAPRGVPVRGASFPLRVIPWSLTQARLGANESFLSIAVGDPTAWPDPSLLSRSPPERPPGCCPCLTRTNKAAVNIHGQVESSCVWDTPSRT